MFQRIRDTLKRERELKPKSARKPERKAKRKAERKAEQKFTER